MKSFLAYAISSIVALVVFGLPANANRYPDHTLVVGPVRCPGPVLSKLGRGLKTVNCSNGAKYKWCIEVGTQFFQTKDGDEYCE